MTRRNTPDRPQILLVEDEPIQAEVLAAALQDEGFRVCCIGSSSEVVPWVRANEPDAILLDLVLPDGDGFSLCDQIRAFSTVPLIMVTSRTEEIDRLQGLNLGADDYICKPLSPPEVIARLNALLRRAVQWRAVAAWSNLELDEDRQRAFWKGEDLRLTAVEFRLLALMAGSPGRIWSRGQLLDSIYDDFRSTNERTIDSHIKKIRSKFTAVAAEADPIQSVYGAGYRFENPSDA